MTTSQIRQSFLDYFASKGCHIIPSAPLVPKDDPTVLFNIAGMQPIVPYLKGRPHPAGTRLANSQKCVRTSDLEEVGDSSHLTFFEMLGHWSLGDYYKKEALEWIWEWLTAPEYLGLESSKLYATVYQGDKQIPRDDQSIGIWQEIFNDQGLSSEVGKRILTLGREDNWWEIPGAEQSPAGPDSEIFYYLGEQANPVFDPEDPDFIEICNSVFMAYQKTPDGYQDLVKKNVDFGGGLERIAMVKQGKDSVYGIDIFVEIDRAIQAIATKDDLRARRIISDHIRTATMMVGDGVVPDNNGAGYVLRRLVRRALREADRIGIDSQLIDQLVPVVIHLYQDAYQNLAQDKDQIIKVLSKEERLFRATLKKGIRLFHKEVQQKLTGEQAFKLFDTYGFPLELSLEEAKRLGLSISKDLDQEFAQSMSEQRERSRTANKGVFKGGLIDHSPKVIRYHTATHILYRALRNILGDHVVQRGSNITAERTRFDFSHQGKLTDRQISQIEQMVNQTIEAGLPVSYQVMPTEQAFEQGALGAFGDRYDDQVKVYQIGEDSNPYSLEICGGPHVENTIEVGKFKIVKEQASSAGVRRIKAVIED